MNNHWSTEQGSYQSIIDASPAGMILVTKEGEIVLVNKMAEVIFGYSRKELISKSIECLVPSQFRSHHMAQRDEFHQDPQMRKMGMGRDLYGLKKDGTEVPVEIGLNIIELSGSKFVLAGIIDISQRKEKEVQLRTMFAELTLLSEKLKKENKEKEELVSKLDELTMIEPLTGLCNRRGLKEKIPQYLKIAKRNKQQVFLFFIDLDNMKSINDALGHNEGDAVLVEVANILKKCFRETDIIARLGGDEFITFTAMMSAGDEKFAFNRLQKLVDERNSACRFPHQPFSLSIGGTPCDLDVAFDLEALLAQADKMMYVHKETKKR